MAHCSELIDLLRGPGAVFIQTHDFPDHDSVASAFGLQVLLRARGIQSEIVYEGEIQRESLTAMNQRLGIVMHHRTHLAISPEDRSVIVDGCVGNRNVSRLVAREVGVIDHHMIEHPESVPFVDIRVGYGACCTIVYDYYRELKVPVPLEAATALLIGIAMDTRNLMRAASGRDVSAYTALHRRADTRVFSAVAGSGIQSRDLNFYHRALENVFISDRFAFCHLPDGCSRNLLGVLGDFFIGLRDADLVVLCAREDGRMNLSVRSDRETWNAAAIVQEALRGIGVGGGHRHAAGGALQDGVDIDADEVYRRFCAVLGVPVRVAHSPILQSHAVA